MENTNDKKWKLSDVLLNHTKNVLMKQEQQRIKEELRQRMLDAQAQQLMPFVPGQPAMPPQEQPMPENFQEYMKNGGGISIDPSKKGTFKAQATRMGMSVQEAARHILANKEKYSPAMVKKANFARNFAKEEGGTINNPGFNALPEYVQNKILSNMEYGGDFEIPEYAKGGGYTVRRTSERKGKTHVVIGPDGTKKYFGDPNMGERSKSKHGKKAFYARHASNLKNNPYFRAYARATWEEGGEFTEEELMLNELSATPEFDMMDVETMNVDDDSVEGRKKRWWQFWKKEQPLNYEQKQDQRLKYLREVQKRNMLEQRLRREAGYANAADAMIPEMESIAKEIADLENYFKVINEKIYNEKLKKELDDQINKMLKEPESKKTTQKKAGGEMIRRADGSYSERGLWDNIRDNEGSGKKPTKEMLAQERKIKRKAEEGGTLPSCEDGYYWNPDTQSCEPVNAMASITESKQFLQDMANSPLFAERYARMTGVTDPAKTEKYRQNIIKNLNTVKYKEDPATLEKIGATGAYKRGLFGNHHTIYRDSKNSRPGTDLHELSHSSTKGFIDYKPNDYMYDPSHLENLFIYDDGSDVYERMNILKDKNPSGYQSVLDLQKSLKDIYANDKTADYLLTPTEIKARIDVLRKDLKDANFYDATKEKFTEEHFDKLKKLFNKKGFESLKDAPEYLDILHNYSKEDIINFFNNIVSNNPKDNSSMARRGGQMRYF